MKLNSPESMATARRLIDKYGSWTTIRENARSTGKGVLVVGSDEDLMQVRDRLCNELARRNQNAR